jgi:hypothetical protein
MNRTMKGVTQRKLIAVLLLIKKITTTYSTPKNLLHERKKEKKLPGVPLRNWH